MMRMESHQSMQSVEFITRDLGDKEALEYAMSKLYNGSYKKGCTIGKVLVNGKIVLEDITIE